MRTFDVLEAFRERPKGLSYKEVLARFPKIPSASVYRILCSLEASGYLRKDMTGRYQLGVKFIEMGHLTEKRQDVIGNALPYMEQLLAEFGENVNLIKVQGQDLVYLNTLEGQQSLRVAEMPNRRQCVHSSASGKVLLAHMFPDEFEECLSQMQLVRLTKNTITRQSLLLEELDKIRRQRYAVDAEENILGVSCVASVILTSKREPVAAMSISAPSFRLDGGLKEKVARRLIEVTHEISRKFYGYPDDDIPPPPGTEGARSERLDVGL